MTDFVRQCVRKMQGYVPGEQPAEGTLIKLNTNENPYPPSPQVREALTALACDKLRLYPDPVSTELRRRIAEIHGCEPAQVFVSNGSDELLGLCTRAFVEDADAIGYFDPSYSLYPVLAEIRNVARKPVDLRADFTWPDGFLDGVPDRYDCALFFLTNPNAPTGILYPKEDVRGLCRRLSGVVLIDEAYVDFAAEHCMDLALSMGNVLVARSLSKSFSLAGLRVGYVVGAVELIEALFKIKDSYNLDRISQRLALAALTDLDYMRRNVKRIRATRQRLVAALKEVGYSVFHSETNFVWVKPAGRTAADVYAELRKRRILVRHFRGDHTAEFLRITVGTDAEIDMLIDAVEDIQEEAPAAGETSPGGRG